MCLDDPNLIALVTDSEYRPQVPVFGLNDVQDIASFIEKNYLTPEKRQVPNLPHGFKN
jgi:molybdopterin-guanine dinucleotide biosynthesis protein B